MRYICKSALIPAVFLAVQFLIRPAFAGSETLQTIHSRKSVRSYVNKPVSKDDLMTIMKAAMAAPSAMDLRPWRFVAITDKKKLNELSEILPYGKMLKNAGAAIAVCGDLAKTFEGKEKEFWVQDCSASTQNILLAVEASGLGAVWIGVYPNDERVAAVSSALGLPPNIIPLNVISIGYPTGEEKPKDKFNKEYIHWESW